MLNVVSEASAGSRLKPSQTLNNSIIVYECQSYRNASLENFDDAGARSRSIKRNGGDEQRRGRDIPQGPSKWVGGRDGGGNELTSKTPPPPHTIA